MDHAQDIAELVSLALTFPTIILAIGVITHWGPQAWHAFKIHRDDRTATQWLILGITVGFIGALLDNLYWSIPWSASYVGSEHTGWLVSYGVFFNIPFRQVAGVYAAYCHLFAFFKAKKSGQSKLLVFGLLSLLVGLSYIAVLSLVR